jgi:pyruvate/2-oxoglutarate dehydrogenase complex dihydrolipoamide dehydrogenase (E3) component
LAGEEGLRGKEDLDERSPVAWRFAMSKKLVIVGGGAGGPSAAAKAKRLDPDLEVTILEAGEHVSFAT